nr:hypothetical protein [Tanacetum cinerariifolium]
MMRKKAMMHALANVCLMRTPHHASRKRNASGCPMQWSSASASETHLGRAFLNTEAPRAWFERLSKALFDLGFKGSKTDPSLFNYSRGDTLLYILVYVDDIIVTEAYFGVITKCWSFGLSNGNPVSSLMVTSSSLSLDDSTAFSNPVKYRQVVGSSQYVTLSRPDIAFDVNKVCQYMHAPTENHWFAVKQILRYLHGTVEHGMLIRRSSCSTLQAFTDVLWKVNPDTSLEAFSDADWARDSDDQRSMGDLLYILVQTLYLGPLVNNVRFRVPLQKKPNTRLLLTLLLSSHGFKLFLMSLKSVHLQLFNSYTML